jgi:hypothetical protein
VGAQQQFCALQAQLQAALAAKAAAEKQAQDKDAELLQARGELAEQKTKADTARGEVSRLGVAVVEL